MVLNLLYNNTYSRCGNLTHVKSVTNQIWTISDDCVLRGPMSVNPFVCLSVAGVGLNTTPKPETLPYPRNPGTGPALYGPVSSSEIWGKRYQGHMLPTHTFGRGKTYEAKCNPVLNQIIRSRQNHNFIQCVIYPGWVMHDLYEIKIELWETMK